VDVRTRERSCMARVYAWVLVIEDVEIGAAS
jgi:hypothetical protein